MTQQPLPHINEYTYRLFALPSFTEGVSRLVDFGSTLNIYNVSDSEAEADVAALYSDWRAIGSDLEYAINLYERSRSGAVATAKQST